MTKKIGLATLFFVLLVTISLLIESDEPTATLSESVESLTESNPDDREAQSRSIDGANPREGERHLTTVDPRGSTRGPERSGVLILSDRIDRFVSHFESRPGRSIAFDVELLGETFPVALTEFDRVPGSAGSGVFFGYIEGEPHSRVSWAFHGDAEVGEIQIHGQDTLRILPAGSGREHRVQAWDPLELKRCAQCLAEEE